MNENARRELKGVMEFLSDHHQEITLLAAELNSKLILLDEDSPRPMYVRWASWKADELMDLLEAQAARCYRVKAEVAHMRKSLKVT